MAIDRGEQQGERRAAVRALVSVAVMAYVGTLIGADRSSATVAALTYLAAVAGSVVLHELAHAWAVRRIGGVVVALRLGFGPRCTPAHSVVDLRPLLIAGHVSWRPPPAARRNQVLTVAAAGIWVHAALVVVALAAGSGRWPLWRIDLLLANVGALVSNSLPGTGALTTTAAGPNDGAQLLAIRRGARQPEPFLLGNDPDLVALRATYRQSGAAAAATAVSDRPDAPQLRLRLATELLGAGAHRDAAELADAAAGAQPSWARDRVLAQSRLLVALLSGADFVDPADLDQAVAAAERAQAGRDLRWPAEVRAATAHTLALARLAQHRDAEAEAIAHWARPATVEPVQQAAVLATIGLAALRQGHRDLAQGQLGEALRLAATEPLTRLLAESLAVTPP